MTPTPYNPPTVRVSDPQQPYQPKPSPVGRAVICLWISAAITGVLTALHLFGVMPTNDLGATVGIGLTTFALMGFIAEKIKAGRGWARWFFLVLYAVGLFGFIVSAFFVPEAFFSQPAVLQGSAVAQLALQTAALAFLFSRASRQWFRTAHA